MHVHGPPRTSRTTAAARPFIAFAVLALAFYSLLAHWEQRGGTGPMFADSDLETHKLFEIEVAKPQSQPHAPGQDGGSLTAFPGQYDPSAFPRRVVAHFMLGNTYPFTEKDWLHTFRLVRAISLDGLVLNLGREDWQVEQAKTAFRVLEREFHNKTSPPAHTRPGQHQPQVFFSLDMTVLPSATPNDAKSIVDKIAPMLSSPAYMRRSDKPILSTFAGGEAFGGKFGWNIFFDYLRQQTDYDVWFIPAFFQAPDKLLRETPYADGFMAWNSAWPQEDKAISMDADRPFLKSGKPFMATVSPLFFTHYGREGEWAFNKNFIYRSDDMLYPTRWAQIMALPKNESPELVQVLSWNDYGESHNIAPVSGAQPGSDDWTNHMDHNAFMEMTAYFTQRWRDGAPEVFNGRSEITLWMWYRPHPKDYTNLKLDRIGRPEHADWARDLINIVVLVPEGLEKPVLEVHNGHNSEVKKVFNLFPGHANGVKVPFVAGPVSFMLRSQKGVHLRANGRRITTYEQTEQYNFNMWSKTWHLNAQDVYTSHRRPSSHGSGSAPKVDHPAFKDAQEDPASSKPDTADDDSRGGTGEHEEAAAPSDEHGANMAADFAASSADNHLTTAFDGAAHAEPQPEPEKRGLRSLWQRVTSGRQR